MQSEDNMRIMLENWLTVGEINAEVGTPSDFVNGWVLALMWALEEPIMIGAPE